MEVPYFRAQGIALLPSLHTKGLAPLLAEGF